MCQYMPIPPVLSCTGIDMYHDVFANGNMQIQTIIHTNISAAGVKPNPYWYVLLYVFARFGTYLVCFGMYLCSV